MSAVVCGSAVRAGAQTVAIPLAHLAAVASAHQRNTQTVVVCMDGEQLSGGAAEWGAAGLSPHHAATTCLAVAVAARSAAAAPAVLVQAARALPAGSQLSLWPHPSLAAAAGLPFLTPHHLDGWNRSRPYVCRECGVGFAEPYPLKVHLYVGCAVGAAASAGALWGAMLRRLAPARLALQLQPLLVSHCQVTVYSRRYGLKIHVRTHTGARPLRCATCQRAFADPSNLNKHRRLHDSARTRTALAHIRDQDTPLRKLT